MAISDDLKTAVTSLATATDALTARIAAEGPQAGFSVSDADVQAAVASINTETAQLNTLVTPAQ